MCRNKKKWKSFRNLFIFENVPFSDLAEAKQKQQKAFEGIHINKENHKHFLIELSDSNKPRKLKIN